MSQEEGLPGARYDSDSWANPKDYQSKLGELESFLVEKQQTWGQEVIGFEFENDFFIFLNLKSMRLPINPTKLCKIIHFRTHQQQCTAGIQPTSIVPAGLNLSGKGRKSKRKIDLGFYNGRHLHV